MILAPLLPAQTATIRLAQGANIPVLPGLPRYSLVGQATLDAKAPETPQALEYATAVGPERSLLLRFGALDAVLPPGARVIGATLTLTVADGQPVALKSIRRVLVPWKSAGPTVLLRRRSTRPLPKPGEKAPPEEPEFRRTSATWRTPVAGGSKWQVPGALGEEDSAPIPGAKPAQSGAALAIGGLEGTVQAMADHPWDNEGFLLGFESEALLNSSLSTGGRPALEIAYEASPPKTGPDLAVVAVSPAEGVRVRNLGTAPSAPYRVRARVDTRPGAFGPEQPGLAPGAEATISAAALGLTGTKAGRVVADLQTSGDTDPRDDGLVSVLGGPEVAAGTPEGVERIGRAVRVWNDAAAGSFFSFAPEGAATRLTFVGLRPGASDPAESVVLRYLTLKAGAPELGAASLDAGAMPRLPGVAPRGAADRFSGLSGGGDARSEVALPPQVNLPLDPYEDPLLRRVPLEPTGGLAGIEVAALENGGKPLGLPRLAVVRVTNAAGRPLTALDLGVYALENGAFGAAPLATIRTNDAGIALVPATLLGSPLLAFVGEANGEREVAFLKLSQLQSAAARGNDAAPIFDLRLNLPTLPVSREASLAAGKILTDSLGTPSSSLAAIADDNPGTGWRATYPPGSWIEVDLGRDRTIAEVGLLGGLPKSFDLRLRGTGEDPSSATRWASEGDWAWTLANRPDGAGGVTYRGTAERGRYLRVVLPEGGAVDLRELRVYAARISSQ